MPGTPATSPRFGVARYSDADTAAFSSQVNAITDGFDSGAAGWLTGTLAARPAAASGNAGKFYYATDQAFSLNGPLAVSTGSAWIPVSANQAPAAWVNLTLGTNISAAGTGLLVPRARFEGYDIVRLAGSLLTTAGVLSGSTLATLPSAGYGPGRTVLSPAGQGAIAAPNQIQISGTSITLKGPDLSSGTTVCLDGITYTLT